MSMYRGYFVPNNRDPSGKDVQQEGEFVISTSPIGGGLCVTTYTTVNGTTTTTHPCNSPPTVQCYRKPRPPRTPKKCCDDAEAAGDGGGVVCCDGRKVSCSWQPPIGSKEADDIIRRCILEHEDDHHDDIGDCLNVIPDLDRPPFRPEANPNAEECKAYQIEIDCLDKGKRECKTTQCRETIQRVIDHKFDYANKTYGCKLTK